jgi:hypothetical protein
VLEAWTSLFVSAGPPLMSAAYRINVR